jgi:hypothetical protein
MAKDNLNGYGKYILANLAFANNYKTQVLDKNLTCLL